MTKEMRARANATIAIALAALATASRTLAQSLAARPLQWTDDDVTTRADRATRHLVVDPTASCAVAPRPIIEPASDELMTGRFRRLARGTATEHYAPEHRLGFDCRQWRSPAFVDDLPKPRPVIPTSVRL
jgi:hypothetical protein